MNSRDYIASLANTYIGCGAAKDKDKYLDLLANDKDSAAMKADMLKMSSCALTVRGLWRKLGCTHKILLDPYKIGKAMSDVMTIGKDYKAWYTPKDQYQIGLGDAVIVGNPGHEHVFTITELLGGLEFVSVDGGQGPGGTSIGECKRRWEMRSGKLTDINNSGSVRPILGYVDISKLGLKSDD